MNGTNSINTTSTPGFNITTITSTVAPIINTTSNIVTKVSTYTTSNDSTITNATAGPMPIPPSPPEFQLWLKIGLVIVSVLTIFGNGIVVYFIFTRHRLRTKTNFMVASLAISDFLVGICIIPSFLACMYVDCDNLLSKLFYDGFLFASVCNLCCITFDRFLAVTRPLRYHLKITRKAVILMIAISWIVPFIVSLVPITWLYSNTSLEKQMLDNKIFYTLQVVVFMFCPCLIMLIAYAVIYNIAWKQTRHIRHVLRSVSNVGNGPRSNSIPTSTTREAKATLKVFGTVVVMFVACWSISAFRTIVGQYQLMDVPWNVTSASRLLLVANSAVNPVIYALWKKDIKNEIKKLLKLNSQLVRPSSATFRSSQDFRNDTSSFAGDTFNSRRSRTNSLQETTLTHKTQATKPGEKNLDKLNDNHKPLENGLTSVENVQIRTVEENPAAPKPTQTVTIGIDNLVTQVDGLV